MKKKYILIVIIIIFVAGGFIATRYKRPTDSEIVHLLTLEQMSPSYLGDVEVRILKIDVSSCAPDSYIKPKTVTCMVHAKARFRWYKPDETRLKSIDRNYTFRWDDDRERWNID